MLDNKYLPIGIVFLLFAVTILLYPNSESVLSVFGGAFKYYPQPGLVLIVGLVIFGLFGLFYKDKNIKISALLLLVILALANIYVNGLKFGIDFIGGTRIPVILEKPVDQQTMASMVDTLNKRTRAFGLTEVKVRAIGNNQINVEVPGNDEKIISIVEGTIAKQGVFQAVVDGKLAVSSVNIYPLSIRPLTTEQLRSQGGADWGVTFSVDRIGGEQFASVAKGKADYPVYLFLDRPEDAILIFDRSFFKQFILPSSSERESIRALKDALKLGNSSVGVFFSDELENVTPSGNRSIAILSKNESADLKSKLIAKGFTLSEKDESDMEPLFHATQSGIPFVSKLPAVGLLSAPVLGAETSSGIPTYGYSITGSVQSTNLVEREKLATAEVQKIQSILKGGSLPVQISLGSRTSLPASLGNEFLKLSLYAILGSLIVISILIGFRYRNIKATLPIVMISLAEFIILVSILGSFTIDLSAMAGIIAAIGVGVDAQIVITDEILKKDDSHTIPERINLAFDIIKTNAVVAICSMIPLFFAGIVEVIGFSISTILGAMLGYLLTRPAYASIVERVIGKGENK